MSRPCEVCRAPRKIRRVLVEDRLVALCDEHAAELSLSGTRSVAELRTLFPEEGGLRSRVGRRAPLDRRVFPPRPEGRRRNQGRRKSDAQG